MLFRNIHFYRLEQSSRTLDDTFKESLNERRIRSCGQIEKSSSGWEAPLGSAGINLTHTINRSTMISMAKQERLLPASIVKKEIEKRMRIIETETGHPISRKEKSDIKDQIITEMLPSSFIKETSIAAYINSDSNQLIINSSSSNKAEELIELLRKTDKSLNATLPKTETSPEMNMTQWIIDVSSLPPMFSIGDGCVLKTKNERSGTIRCKNIDVSSDEIKAHLHKGLTVTSLDLVWDEKISFTLCNDLSLKKIKFDTEMSDKNQDDNPVAIFDADFVMMSSELNSLLNDLMSTFKPPE